MAGSSRASSSKSTAGASGRVQKKAPSKASAKASSAGSNAVYTGTAKGVTQLPVARIKRIIKEDKDVQMVSNDAVFVISLATVRDSSDSDFTSCM